MAIAEFHLATSQTVEVIASVRPSSLSVCPSVCLFVCLSV